MVARDSRGAPPYNKVGIIVGVNNNDNTIVVVNNTQQEYQCDDEDGG